MSVVQITNSKIGKVKNIDLTKTGIKNALTGEYLVKPKDELKAMEEYFEAEALAWTAFKKVRAAQGSVCPKGIGKITKWTIYKKGGALSAERKTN